MEESVPKPPAVSEDLQGREKELAEEAARDFEPSNRDLMNVITHMARNMVVRDEVKADVVEALGPVRAQLHTVEARSTQALEETKALNERLIVIESGAIAESDRVCQLETAMKEVQSAIPDLSFGRPKVDWGADAADPMYRSVGFFGFKAEDGVEFRRRKVDELLKQRFPDAAYSVGFDYKGPRKNGNLKSYCYATFLTRDEADRVLSELNGKKYELKNGKGDMVKYDKPRTSVQRKRWACMVRAEEIVKAHERSKGFEVKIESKMPVRKVTVQGEVVFEQERDDAIGTFVGKFADVMFKFKE